MSQSLPLLTRLAKHLHPHTVGMLAEKVALARYLALGFRPLPLGPSRKVLAQTDLTLVRGQTILLVEVKFRQTRERGHLAVTPAQKQRLQRQMQALAGRYPHSTLRIELCLVFLHWPFVQRIHHPYTF